MSLNWYWMRVPVTIAEGVAQIRPPGGRLGRRLPGSVPFYADPDTGEPLVQPGGLGVRDDGTIWVIPRSNATDLMVRQLLGTVEEAWHTTPSKQQSWTRERGPSGEGGWWSERVFHYDGDDPIAKLTVAANEQFALDHSLRLEAKRQAASEQLPPVPEWLA